MYRRTLRRHRRFHTGERPHGCSLCSRAFILRRTLRQHQKAHFRRPYSCTQCGKRFRQLEEAAAALALSRRRESLHLQPLRQTLQDSEEPRPPPVLHRPRLREQAFTTRRRFTTNGFSIIFTVYTSLCSYVLQFVFVNSVIL